jgi:LysM repeat protein
MAYTGYHFFVGDLELPYAPSELNIKIGGNNKTVELINGKELNILKNPKLTEIEFDIELPRGRQYPFANKLVSSKTYTDYFEKLMLEKLVTKLVITRPNPFLRGGTGIGGTIKDFESTVLNVSLENYDIKESAENAYDVTVSLQFKEYPSYGTAKKVTIQNKKKKKVKTVTKTVTTNKKYTVKKGDCLWKISRKYYGTGNKWKTIYNANKSLIEKTARKYGKKSSSNGHWIYPGTKLTIPVTTKVKTTKVYYV